MVPENKQNSRYKQINFIGLQNNRNPSQHTVGRRQIRGVLWTGGLLSVSLPKEHHERRTFCRRGGNPRTCDSGSAIDS
jgi:hypothetical protein